DVFPFSAKQPYPYNGRYGGPMARQTSETGKFITVDDTEKVTVRIFSYGKEYFHQMVLIIVPIIEKNMPQSCPEHNGDHGMDKKGIQLFHGLLFGLEDFLHQEPTHNKGRDPK